MQRMAFWLVFLWSSWTIILPVSSNAQQVETPVYRDGDSWRVKVDVSHSGISRSGRCEEMYSEYLVKIENGKLKVYVSKTQETIDCPAITSQLLDKGEDRGFLKFPLRVGTSWSFQYQRGSPGTSRAAWVTAETKVSAWEKVKTEKGELEAYKIERAIGSDTETYWYAPAAKAIVLFDRKTARVQRRVTLVDFNVKE